MGAVRPNGVAFVVVDHHVLIFLGMDVDLFHALFILKPQLIEAIALVGLAFDRHAGLVFGQFVGRQVGFAVGAAGGDWLVGVTVEVLDDQFLTDARYRHRAPGGARPALGDADPAGAVFVVLAGAVPREADFDPAPLVAEDFFAGRADHSGGLRAVDARFGAQRGFPVEGGGRQSGRKVIAGARGAASGFFLLAAVLEAGVDDAHGAPADVQVFARVVGQVEGFSRLQTGVVTLDLGDAGIAAQGVQAGLGEGLAGDVALCSGRDSQFFLSLESFAL